jgi:hypothetical protein
MLTKKEMLLLIQALNDLAENQECSHAESKKLLSKIKDINYAYVTKVKKEHWGFIPQILL